ncbi:MAG: hypothetical protein HeimC3_04520 [Candidatus Heimdallarchaeota archaeon LC_3]|nr:MAG: hypothetical protein HeimC3_04520 [Candidatus Heimdallarchaeota archaeon LC_3]
MKKYSIRIGLVFTLFIVINTFLISNTVSAEVQSPTQAETIYIASVPGTKFNVTEVALEKNTQYEIVFVNVDVGVPHNLVIVKTDTYANSGTIDTVDKISTLGPEPTDFSQPGTEEGRTWSYTWTTPDSDSWVIFACSFVGHYPTMNGYFKIGNPSEDDKPNAPTAGPGFELVVGLIAVLGLAGYRIKRN